MGNATQSAMLGSSLRGAVRAARAPRLLARPVSRAYHENIIDHYESPRNVGSLDKNDPSVGTGLVGAPACGDVMKLQMSIKDGRVENAVFKTFGCGSAIASSSYATEWLKGKTIEECAAIQNSDIASYLKLPPVKLHCSMLAEDAVKLAIKDYQSKQEERDAVAKAAAAGSS